MQRYFIHLSYNGTSFFGWQRQPSEVSVQEVIEKELTKIHSNNEIKVFGCGRTDSGVHAKHFVLHVDLPQIKDEAKFIFKLNKMLPHSISIQKVETVADGKHARFNAKSRTYRYFIHQNKNPFNENLSWYIAKNIDILKMNEAAKTLLGKQDFTSLSKLHTDVKTNICTVSKAKWTTTENGFYFEITADRFLRNMVRASVGTLVDIGLGKLNTEDFATILEAKDRQAASTSVPAHGLFLWKVDY